MSSRSIEYRTLKELYSLNKIWILLWLRFRPHAIHILKVTVGCFSENRTVFSPFGFFKDGKPFFHCTKGDVQKLLLCRERFLPYVLIEQKSLTFLYRPIAFFVCRNATFSNQLSAVKTCTQMTEAQSTIIRTEKNIYTII